SGLACRATTRSGRRCSRSGAHYHATSAASGARVTAPTEQSRHEGCWTDLRASPLRASPKQLRDNHSDVVLVATLGCRGELLFHPLRIEQLPAIRSEPRVERRSVRSSRDLPGGEAELHGCAAATHTGLFELSHEATEDGDSELRLSEELVAPRRFKLSVAKDD